MRDSEPTRRNLLRGGGGVTSVALLGALAGCQGSENDGSDPLEKTTGDGPSDEVGVDVPAVAFQWEFSTGTQSSNELEATIINIGDRVTAGSLRFTGTLGEGDSVDETWATLAGIDEDTQLTAGDSVIFDAESLDGRAVTGSYEVEIVWIPPEGGDSSILSSDSGPDA